MLFIFLKFLLSVLLVEAISELVVKSELFFPLRKKVKISYYLSKLFNCGYCFSFWAAFLIVGLGVFYLNFTSFPVLNFFFSSLVLQRSANILHNCIDKFTDKYYSQLHINSEKEDD